MQDACGTTIFDSISMELTSRCNLHCAFCYASASQGGNASELDAAGIMDFLARFRGSGGRRVLYTGGEVFLRPDLPELIEYAHSIGLMVDLFTNGTLLKADHMQLLATKANLVNVSLDGPALVHDQLRGENGAFGQTLRAVEMLDAAGVRFGLQCMVTPLNLDAMDWLIPIINRTHPLMVKLAHVARMGRAVCQDRLFLPDDALLSIKAMARRLAADVGHFHLRVTTNVTTAAEFRAFYPSLAHVLQPWMLSDGTILGCYAPEAGGYWTLSTARTYPELLPSAPERLRRLAADAHQSASNLSHFDMLEVIHDSALRIADGSGSI